MDEKSKEPNSNAASSRSAAKQTGPVGVREEAAGRRAVAPGAPAKRGKERKEIAGQAAERDWQDQRREQAAGRGEGAGGQLQIGGRSAVEHERRDQETKGSSQRGGEEERRTGEAS